MIRKLLVQISSLSLRYVSIRSDTSRANLMNPTHRDPGDGGKPTRGVANASTERRHASPYRSIPGVDAEHLHTTAARPSPRRRGARTAHHTAPAPLHRSP